MGREVGDVNAYKRGVEDGLINGVIAKTGIELGFTNIVVWGSFITANILSVFATSGVLGELVSLLLLTLFLLYLDLLSACLDLACDPSLLFSASDACSVDFPLYCLHL